MYDGVQMYKELKEELDDLHDAHATQTNMNKQSSACATSCCPTTGRARISPTKSTLIRDYDPYISVPYAGERLDRLTIKFLPAALAGEGRALLRDLFDKNALGKESCVIDEAMRL
eukprot:5827242-Pleurochrysis_carterae.AAC.1